MAKRIATNELTDRNWDQEEEKEEAGVFIHANASTMSGRKVITAKRRVQGETNSESGGAFKGFGGFASSSGGSGIAFNSLAPKSLTSTPAPQFSFGKLTKSSDETDQKPANVDNSGDKAGNGNTSSAILNTTTNDASSVKTGFNFGGNFAVKTFVKNDSATGFQFGMGAAASNNAAAVSSSSEQASVTLSSSSLAENTFKSHNPQHLSKLKALNESVTKWIKEHVDSNPYCILSPIFRDYDRHLASIDERFVDAGKKNLSGTQDKDKSDASKDTNTTLSNSNNNHTAVVSNAVPSVFGSEVNKAIFTANVPTSKSLTESKDSTASSSSTTSVITFGSLAAKPSSASSTFSFSTAASTSASSTSTATVPSFGFTFKAASTSSTTVTSDIATTTVAAPFKFGLSAGLSGGPLGVFSQTSSSTVSTGGSATSTLPSLFSAFGANSSLQSSSLFSAKPLSTPIGSGFFTRPPAAEASKSDEQEKEGDGDEKQDEEYVPPKVESTQVKEEDAIYSIKCKLFSMKDGTWAERGVGFLYLKPCGDKTQLLIRADNNLGTILLNIILTNSLPVKRIEKGNGIMLTCVPNPPIGKEPSDKPINLLIRVKTSEDADEMLKKINEMKS